MTTHYFYDVLKKIQLQIVPNSNQDDDILVISFLSLVVVVVIVVVVKNGFLIVCSFFAFVLFCLFGFNDIIKCKYRVVPFSFHVS